MDDPPVRLAGAEVSPCHRAKQHTALLSILVLEEGELHVLVQAEDIKGTAEGTPILDRDRT